MATKDPFYLDESGIPVSLPSGAVYQVLTSDEVHYVEDRVRDYTQSFKWDNTSDLQDVDRMIMSEMLIHRYQNWLSRRADYLDDPIDETGLRKAVNEASGELRQLKKSLGIDKISREKERGDDSVPAYLERLRQRAKEFGVNRNLQMDKGFEMCNQLIALYQLMENCDAQERIEMHCRPEDIIDWIGTSFIPDFQIIDTEFRKTSQRYWVQDL
jgi:hypothetical protein